MFDIDQLFLIVVITSLIFFWLFFYKEKKVRIFFLFFAAMYILYSGLGAALKDVSTLYKYYYYIFTLCISCGIYWGLHSIHYKKNAKKNWSDFISFFIDRYAKTIVFLYFVCKISPLIIPEIRLDLLIKPPTPDVINMLHERFGDSEQNIIISFISGISTLIYPFYLLSLYKYRKQTVKLSLIVIIPYYLQYCATAYLGRGSMMEALLIIVGITYFERPKLAKRIILASAFLLPALMVFFVKYSIQRIGGTVGAITYSEAISVLLEQECYFPLHFDKILHLQGNYIINYLVWLFTMPLPGFFRGDIDVHFAAMFSEDILGRIRGENGFYILLPGVVGESVYLLGKDLFWINGLLYGFIMGITFKILIRYPQLICILIYVAIDFGYVTNRAGFFGGFPFVGKVLLYFYLILLFLKNHLHWKRYLIVQENRK